MGVHEAGGVKGGGAGVDADGIVEEGGFGDAFGEADVFHGGDFVAFIGVAGGGGVNSAGEEDVGDEALFVEVDGDPGAVGEFDGGFGIGEDVAAEDDGEVDFFVRRGRALEQMKGEGAEHENREGDGPEGCEEAGGGVEFCGFGLAAQVFAGQEGPEREEDGDEEGERELEIGFLVQEQIDVAGGIGEEAGEEEVGWPEEEAGDVRGEAGGPSGVAEKARETRAGEEGDGGGGGGPEDCEELSGGAQGAHVEPEVEAVGDQREEREQDDPDMERPEGEAQALSGPALKTGGLDGWSADGHAAIVRDGGGNAKREGGGGIFDF